jgi:hypothetical protein
VPAAVGIAAAPDPTARDAGADLRRCRGGRRIRQLSPPPHLLLLAALLAAALPLCPLAAGAGLREPPNRLNIGRAPILMICSHVFHTVEIPVSDHFDRRTKKLSTPSPNHKIHHCMEATHLANRASRRRSDDANRMVA